jgi:putative transport protein
VGATADDLALPGLGYAVAYPFGIVGILLAMWLLRVVLRIGIDRKVEAFERQQQFQGKNLKSRNVTVRNANLDGITLSRVPGLKELDVVCSRMMRDGKLRIPHAGTPLALGDIVHLVGSEKALEEMQLILGEESGIQLTTKGTELRVDRIVVTKTGTLGKTINELALHKLYGVLISRVNRAGVELLPRPNLSLQFGDILNIVGQPEAIAEVARVVGNAQQKLQQVQMIPIFVGIGLGVLLGSLPLYLPGMPSALKLGMAGGPLVVALVLSRIANIGPIYWFMPPSANLALREIGIVLFLAVVGLKSGKHFVETLLSAQGPLWILYGAVITLAPLLIVGFFARLVMKLNYLTTCGLLAGSMTDPPALAFANGLSTSEAPALAFATVYPLVMCLRILAPQILVLALWTTGTA